MHDVPSIIERLGRKTIQMALKGETAEKRANAVQKIGREIRDLDLSEADRVFATKILDRICKDVSDLVRRALSVTLRKSPCLPLHIARRLIDDIDSIAVPILSDSPVLTDEDLLRVLQSRAAEKIRAIAQRQTLGLHISHAIVSFGDSQATAKLAANDGALISQETAEMIAEIHADDDLIRNAALARHDFPMAVFTKLIDHAAQKIDMNLEAYKGVSSHHANRLTRDIKERAYSYVTTQNWSQKKLKEFVMSLEKSGKLTPRLILRAAGRGDIAFVVFALSRLGGQTLGKTKLLVTSGHRVGAKAIAIKAGFLPIQVKLFMASIGVWLSVEKENSTLTSEAFQRKVAERLLSQDLDLTEEMELDLLDLLDTALNPKLVA